ncbi:hypothetical protein Sango_1806600 [Sesamum angolense]|uniref:Zinc-finger domain-containing protein n=1 Tax=Sesamum angolense TaxID=2727404 RepID=A0AAE1WHH7_9LAMI|nr:hypothetical protein Sango_1806600 [Sesamum angolense]
MVTLRSRALENVNILGEKQQQETMGKEDGGALQISEYELSREERIKENRERMQKLGIVDLSLKLKALRPTANRGSHRKTPQVHSPLPPSGPVRRSSRLQNSTPVSYCEEVRVGKKDRLLNDDDLLREVGSKPEIYTEEHETLLGSTEMSWTLFVDGCSEDGKRIYDPVRGKTCHQCRQAKGWPPTGSLYRKISNLGYKSVAHYLIQTRRSNTDSDKEGVLRSQNSAKRSLAFSNIEVTKGEDGLSKLSSEYSDTDPQSEFDKECDDIKVAPESGPQPLLEPAVASQSYEQVEFSLSPEPEENGAGCDNDKQAKLLMDSEQDNSSIELKATIESKKDSLLAESSNFCNGLVSETLERGDDDDDEIKKAKIIMDNKDFVAPETSPKSTKKRALCELPPDSIAARLRQRRNKTNNTSKELGLVNTICTTRHAEETASISNADSIARRLKMRRRT